MSNNVLIDKSIIKQIKTSNISRIKAKQIIKALDTINTSEINSMIASGKIKKVSINAHTPMYMYRVNLKDRIIFSEIDNKRIIQKIISVD